jgi:hypothetical protein
MPVFGSSISVPLDLTGEGAVTGTKILWGQMTLSLTAVPAGLWGATEWTAMRLGFQPALGPAWFFAAAAPVYKPYMFFAWWYPSTHTLQAFSSKRRLFGELYDSWNWYNLPPRQSILDGIT